MAPLGFCFDAQQKRKDGTYKDIAHPINNETRRMIEEKIIAEYQKVLAEGGSAKALDND
jgi:stage V sporulation protein G